MDDLLAALKTLFVKLFEPFLATFLASLHAVNSSKAPVENAVSWNFAKAFDNWDNIFDKLLAGLEGKAAQVSLPHVEVFPSFNSAFKDRKVRAKTIQYQNVEPSLQADDLSSGEQRR